MESNDTYPYFNLLTNNIRSSLTIIDKRYNSCLRLRHLTNSLNITALIILIYGFIKYYPEPFNLMYCMISSSIISYLGVVIMNKPEEELKK